MVVSTNVLRGEARVALQATVTGVSILLHGIIRPYEDPAGNGVVVLFGICELLGILGAEEDTMLQWIHVILLVVSIMVVVVFSLKDAIETVKIKQKQLEDAADERSSSSNMETFTTCEQFMLIPFVIVAAIPIIGCILICLVMAYAVNLLVYAAYILGKESSDIAILRSKPRSELKSYERSLVGKPPAATVPCCIPLYPIFRLILRTCLWPLFVVTFVSTKTKMKNAVAIIRLYGVANSLGNFVWKWMYEYGGGDGKDDSNILKDGGSSSTGVVPSPSISVSVSPPSSSLTANVENTKEKQTIASSGDRKSVV
jgi:hypothetical protein